MDVERLPPIGRPPDEAIPFFTRSPVPVPTGFYPPTTGGKDMERLPPIPRSPDEAIPFFTRSPEPVPTGFYPPTTGKDVERLPPIPKSPDEAVPWHIAATVLRPPIVVPATGEDRERLPPIPRSPDEATPFFQRSLIVVPTFVLPRTGEDVERLPPIPRSPDEAIPFFVRSPNPVPTTWLPRREEDLERLPPLMRPPDEAIPFFRSISKVPSAFWFSSYDQPPVLLPASVEQQRFIGTPPAAASTIAGMAWYNWQDRERPPPQSRSPDENFAWFVRSPVPVPTIYWFSTYDQPPRLIPVPSDPYSTLWAPRAPVVVSTIAGMAWFNPPDPRLPPVIGDPEVVQAYPPFIEPPLVPFYAQTNADDFNPLTVIVPGDGVSATWSPRTPTAVSTIAGMAWYVAGERYQPLPPVSGDGMFTWDPRFVPAVGISGIGWFYQTGPDTRPYPGVAGWGGQDGTSTWTAKIPPAPVGISGIGWYTPAEQIVRIDPVTLQNLSWATTLAPNIPPIFVANQFTVSGPGVIDLFDPVTGVNYIFSPTQRRTV